MLRVAQRKGAKLAAAVAAAGLVLTPAIATGRPPRSGRQPCRFSFDPVSSFTPANADPKLAAALGGKSLALGDFKFTPAPAKGRPSQVRVAIRARVLRRRRRSSRRPRAAAAAVIALTPTGYNLGVAVGWRHFAVCRRCRQGRRAPILPSAAAKRQSRHQLFAEQPLHRRVAVGADRATGNPVAGLHRGDNVSLDLGSSYSLSRHISLTGGVRYNIERDRFSALQDNRRDSQAVYVGTAFKF